MRQRTFTLFRTLWVLILMAMLAPQSAVACGCAWAPSMYAELVAEGKHSEARDLVDSFRKLGPRGLELLLDARIYVADQLAAVEEPERYEGLMQQLAEFDQFVDVVGGQRYCTTSKLFWYTDLEQAKVQSRETGKPILSLRMLGKLTEELSCANSRFFRTTLYSNTDVSNKMREHFILHWESVRPVPVITVDFGDGRKLVRTITGNSAHYVLDAEGNAMDVLPGLYSPQEFSGWLDRMTALGEQVKTQPDRRIELTAAYHNRSLANLRQRWKADMQRVLSMPSTASGEPLAVPAVTAPKVETPSPSTAPISADTIASPPTTAVTQTTPPLSVNAATPQQSASAPGSVPAAVAVDVAVPKRLVEAKSLNSITMATVPTSVPATIAAAVANLKGQVEMRALASLSMQGQMTMETADEVIWDQLASLYTGNVEFDGTSQFVMNRENPAALDASRVARSKVDIEGPMLAKMFDRLKSSIAMDTVRNEYQLHRQIHEWFLQGDTGADLVKLNERVYAELFLTPSSDPWLGLVERDVYTGLTNAGVKN